MTVAPRGARRAGAAWTMVCAALLLAALPAPHDAAARAQERPADCRLAAPASWQGVSIEWLGPCAQGAAQGAGVAIARAAGREPERFFGTASAGQLAVGVFDLPDGYRPARFEKGAAVTLEDRNQIIAAFRTASDAARQVSARLKAAGKGDAARAYAEDAERLASQMD